MVLLLSFIIAPFEVHATQTEPYNYYVGPWVWVDDSYEPHWQAPSGTIGQIDLRTSAQSSQTVTPEGYGLFVTKETLPPPYVLLANGFINEALVSEQAKNSAKSVLGYKPTADIIIDVIFEMLTTRSDPNGELSVKPLMPTSKSELEVWLGGHSKIISQKFVYGSHPHTNKVRDVLRKSYRKAREEAVLKGNQHHRKVLDFFGEKYKVDDPENHFIPDDLPKEKRLKHETVITETWDCADSDNISCDLTWTEDNTDHDIVSNEMVNPNNNDSAYSSVGTLSSDDAYAQVEISVNQTNNSALGVVRIRVNGTTDHYGMYILDKSGAGDEQRLEKRVSGTTTTIAGPTATTAVDGDLFKVEADGSTIKGYREGVEEFSVTDTSVTGYLRAGIVSYYNTSAPRYAKFDNFEAGDIGGGSPPAATGRRIIFI